MAELYRFFNSAHGDRRTYQASDFAEYFGTFIESGVFKTDDSLSVMANGTNMAVTIKGGPAFIKGHMYFNTDDTLNLTHDTADATNDRIDRVVLRLDRTLENRYIKAFIIKGEPNLSPVAPSLTRDDEVYELSLAQVRIVAGKSFIEQSQVTDERFNQSVCGIATISKNLMDEWRSWFDNLKDNSYITNAEFNNVIIPFYREIANLKLYQEANQRVENGNVFGINQDTRFGVNVDNFYTNTTQTRSAGNTTISVVNTNGLSVGQEITIQDDVNKESVTITAINGNTLTITSLTNSYKIRAAVYRSNGLLNIKDWLEDNIGQIGVKLDNPTELPPSNSTGVIFSNSGKFVAVTHAMTFLSMYKFDKEQGMIGEKINNPQGFPSSLISHFRFTNDDRFIVFIKNNTLIVRAFDEVTGIGNEISSIVPGLGNITTLTISKDEKFIALGVTGTPFIAVYPFNKTTGILGARIANPSTALLATANDIHFSPSGNYIAVATNSDTAYAMSVYNFNPITGAFGSRITFTTGINWYGNAIRFSNDEKWILYGSNSNLQVFPFNEGVIGNAITTVVSGVVRGLYFSNDGKFLAIRHSSSPFYRFYNWTENGFGTALTNPTGAPSSFITDINFSNDDKYMCFGGSVSPFMFVYRFNHKVTPLLTTDVRFKLLNTDEVVMWIERDSGLSVNARLNGAQMIKETEENEDQFTYKLSTKRSAEVKLELIRLNTSNDLSIKQILGGISR